ncbi:hypothetical protein [Nostoc sp.]
MSKFLAKFTQATAIATKQIKNSTPLAGWSFRALRIAVSGSGAFSPC